MIVGQKYERPNDYTEQAYLVAVKTQQQIQWHTTKQAGIL